MHSEILSIVPHGKHYTYWQTFCSRAWFSFGKVCGRLTEVWSFCWTHLHQLLGSHSTRQVWAFIDNSLIYNHSGAQNVVAIPSLAHVITPAAWLQLKNELQILQNQQVYGYDTWYTLLHTFHPRGSSKCVSHIFREKGRQKITRHLYRRRNGILEIHSFLSRSLANILNNQEVTSMRFVYDINPHNSLNTAMHPTNHP